MKTIPLVILGCLLSAVCADPASDLKKLLEQGVTSGPEFEKAVAAVQGGGANPAAPATNAPPMAYDRLDVGGKVYEQVTVRKVEPDGLSICMPQARKNSTSAICRKRCGMLTATIRLLRLATRRR